MQKEDLQLSSTEDYADADEEEYQPTRLDGIASAFLKIQLVTMGSGAVIAGAFATAVGLHDFNAPTPEEQLQRWGYDASLLSDTPAHGVPVRIIDATNPLSFPKMAWERLSRTLNDKYRSESLVQIAMRIWGERSSQGYAMSPQNPGGTGYIAPMSIDGIRMISDYTMPDGATYRLFEEEELEALRATVLLHEWEHIETGADPNGSTIAARISENNADFFAVPSAKKLTGQDISQTYIRWRILNSHGHLFDPEYPTMMLQHETALMLKKQQMGLPADPNKDYSYTFEIAQEYEGRFGKEKTPQNIQAIIAGVKSLRDDNSWYMDRDWRTDEEKANIGLTLDTLIEALEYLEKKGPEPHALTAPQSGPHPQPASL